MSTNEVIVLQRIYLKRNLENYNFSISLSDKKATEIFFCIKQELEKLPQILGDDFTFKTLLVSKLNYLELKKLQAQGIIPNRIQNNIGRGLAISKKCFILINFDDHITIGTINNSKSLNVDSDLDVLYKVESALQQSLPFAFDDNLGFLTSSTDYFGTGIVFQFLSVFYFMSYGENYIKKVHSNLSGFFTLQIAQNFLDDVSPSKYIFNITSEHSHYKDPKSQLLSMNSVIDKVIQNEIEDRNNFIQNSYDEAYDLVLRAFLIIKNAILISETNMIDLLVTLRFGLSTNILKNATLDKIDKFTVELKTPFIVEQILNESKISMQDVTLKMIDKKRADILHKAFEDLKIKEYENGTKLF